MYLGLHLLRFYGGRPGPFVPLLAALVAAAALAGCGGNSEPTPDLSEGAKLAARLPSENALSIAMVDVAAVRASLGLKPGSIASAETSQQDRTFTAETFPALAALNGANFPKAIHDAVLSRAQVAATTSGDGAATVVTTAEDPGEFADLLRRNGLRLEGSAFVPDDGAYAIALGDGLIAVADDSGRAEAIIEGSDDTIPDQLAQIDGDGQLVTLSKFSSKCVDAVASSDSIGEDGELAFFTRASPDPTRIQTPPSTNYADALRPRAVDDSVRVTVPGAGLQDEPPALTALQGLEVFYPC